MVKRQRQSMLLWKPSIETSTQMIEEEEMMLSFFGYRCGIDDNDVLLISRLHVLSLFFTLMGGLASMLSVCDNKRGACRQ
mmetsp:Transcript_35948/g.73358  ORF Transcript_35948/g.73358 Transcript_35948/m.73358 type:complete len:80 (+) Transcript_35948:552-791(+)